MSGKIFNLHSTVTVPREELDAVIESIELPDGIAAVEKTVNNNVVKIESVADDEEISQYTPTAIIKATFEEKTERPEREPGKWKQPDEEEEVEIITYAGFKGYGESVLYNKALQFEMFDVLCQIATSEEAEGTITALVVTDGELHPVRIEDGERVSAEVDVVESETGEEASWKSNEFI